MNFCRGRRERVNFYLMQPFFFPSSPPHLVSPFFCSWTLPCLFIVYDSISNSSSGGICLAGGAVVLFLCVCTILPLWYSLDYIWISNFVSDLLALFYNKVTLSRKSPFQVGKERHSEICWTHTSLLLESWMIRGAYLKVGGSSHGMNLPGNTRHSLFWCVN